MITIAVRGSKRSGVTTTAVLLANYLASKGKNVNFIANAGVERLLDEGVVLNAIPHGKNFDYTVLDGEND